MMWFWLLSLFLMPQSSSSSNSAALAGEWHNVDYRQLEVVANGCSRAWIEEKKWALQTLPDNRVQGAYQSVIRAIPVGAPSFSPNCRFPAPTSNPIANQFRMWTVVGSPQPDGSWRLRGQPAPGGGDFSTNKTEEFSTELRLVNGTLRDGIGTGDDIDKVIFFRRPTAAPSAARSALQATIMRLHNGGCLEVFNSLAANKNAVAEVCELRRQMQPLQGRYVSLAVDAETQLDRIPKSVPAPSAYYVRQRAVFYELTLTFEKARVPGNVVVIEDGGTWRVAALW